MSVWNDSEIGRIPSSWQVVSIGEVADVTKLAGFEYTKHFEYVDDGEIIALRALNVREGHLDLADVKRIKKCVSDSLIRSKLFLGDILFTYVGANIGQFAMVDKNDTYHLAPNICRIRPGGRCLPFFIFSYFRTEYFRDNLANYSVGSSQPTLPMGNIRKILIPLPPLPEQRAIASVLSSLDDKIDLLHRQNKTLEAMAETLFRQWFVEEADEGWEEGKLGEVLSLIESGSRPKGGIDPDLKNGIPSIGAENIKGIGQYDYSKTKFITEDFFKSMKRGMIHDYDVLIYKDGAYIGRKGMLGHNYPYDICTINEHVFILKCNNKLNQFFLYFLLQEEDLSQLNANSAQPGLNQEAMKSFEIIIPPKQMIDEFGNTVKPWIDKIFFNAKQIRTLSKLRDTLLPKLMSREVRVIV